MNVNVIVHCDGAAPQFMVIDPDRSALKKIGAGIYKGPAGEIYVKCSKGGEEERKYFHGRFVQSVRAFFGIGN